MRACATTSRGDIWGDILERNRPDGAERVRTDTAKLVDQGKSAEHDMVADRHVPCQRSIVGKNRLIADLAVVRYMDVRHNPVVIADPRYGEVLRSADIDRTELAYGVAGANLKPGRFAGIFFILRNFAKRDELKNPVILSDHGVSADHGMRTDSATITDDDIGPYDGIRSNRDVRSK